MDTPVADWDLNVDNYMFRGTAVGEDTVEICGHVIHPLAAAFDILPEPRLRELCESIATNGLRVPIVRDSQRRIVDGQNRLLACAITGTEPTFREVDEADVAALVMDLNLNRRDLTPAQRAVLVAKLTGSDAQARKKAAAKAGVSERAARQAAVVTESGIPELAEAVQSGKVPLKSAEQLAQLPAEKQAEVLANFGDETRDRDRGNDSVKAAVEAHVAKKREAKPFDFKVWRQSAENAVSKLVLRAPEDLRDRARVMLGEVVNATVRVQYEDATAADSFEDAVLEPCDVVAKVAELVKELPKSDRKEAERLLSEAYKPAPVPIKKADDALAAIDAIREGLSQAEQKKLAKLLGGSAPAEAATIEDSAEAYPADPAKACTRFAKAVAAECGKLSAVKFPTQEDRALVLKAVGKAEVAIGRMQKSTKSLEDSDEVEWPEHLRGEKFQKLWERWLMTRRTAGKFPTCDVQNSQLRKLQHFDLAQASEILEKAIENEWQGIPVYSQLATTLWDGRHPAFPPANAEPASNGAAKGNGTSRGNGKPAVDRSQYGKFDPSNRTTDEDWK